MPTVEQGIKSQLRNIEKQYGRSMDELVTLVAKSGLTKHKEVVAMLKQRYGMTHGAAHRVSLVARDRVAPASQVPAAELAPGLQEAYKRLLETIDSMGDDIEHAQKKGYVSLRRRKQFAMLQPGARWINVGLILRQHQSRGRLEPAAKWNALFTHRVRVVVAAADVDHELEAWLRTAYDDAS
ncbi:MAG: DUF4287 domain-containing protein [Chloroflexi bacterium]|nr:MAG: DUF4287 domain-containing protein [Chloroflexota bacterium]